MIKKLFNTTSLKANIIANFVGNGWAALIGIIFVPIYLKYIGAEGYGLIGIFASLQIVLSLLDSGLSTTLNKEMSRLSVLPDKAQQMQNLVKTLGSVYWIMAFIAGFIALCLSPLIAKYWVHPKDLSVQTITYAFVLLSVSLVFQFPTGFYSGGLLGLQRQVILNVVRIVFATLRSVGAVLVLALVSNSVLAFFGWSLFIAIVQAFMMKFFLWYYLPKTASKPIFDKQELKNIYQFAAGMMGISLTAILLTQVDKIILSKILSLEQFGYYTVSCTLGLMIYQLVAPIAQSYFPKFSTLISLNKIDELKELYHQGCQLVSVLVLPATFILFFFSKELILIWTHNPVTADNTWLITAVYALGTGINGLMNIPYSLTLSYGWPKLAIFQNIIFLIIMIPLTLFLSFKYGAVGGAFSWTIINLLYFFITPHLIHNRFLKGEAFNWYWKDSLKPLAACLLVLFIGRHFIILSSYNIFFQLIIIAFLSILSISFSLIFANSLNKNLIVFYKSLKVKYHG